MNLRETVFGIIITIAILAGVLALIFVVGRNNEDANRNEERTKMEQVRQCKELHGAERTVCLYVTDW